MTENNLPEVAETIERVPVASTSRGFVMNTIDEAWRMAQFMAKSEFVPKNLRGNPGSILVAMQFAKEVGLPVLQGLQNIAVINGKTSLYGDVALAVVQSHPDYEWHKEYFEGEAGTDGFKAVCEMMRAGSPEPAKRSFSIGQAKHASLWNKVGPWKSYPERMLQMRARAWAMRDAFADALTGMAIAEEARDIPVQDVAYTDVDPLAPTKGRVSASPAIAAAEEPEIIDAVVEETPIAEGEISEAELDEAFGTQENLI